MNPFLHTPRPPVWPALLLGLAFAAVPALGADKATAASQLARYQQERAKCSNGESNQDRPTCLKEAAAAYAEARRGDEVPADPALYARNALLRCERLPADERSACVARMQGQGSTTGSARGGGIYRELVTRETMPAVPAAAASMPASVPAR
ncbi:MAG: hypothetical protein HY855_05400 [Burkholderiales bacterium]|nr:hypothetical protein [Burkholderiales bacterium]